MAQNYEQIEVQAMTLSPVERERLAERLLISVQPASAESEPEHLNAWLDESSKRMAEVDAGHVRMVSMDSVLKELRARHP